MGAVLGTLAVSLIEPMYVAAGFTLYLQRRTMLEGWDIELRFRHLTDRVAAAAPRMAAALAAFAFGCAILAAPSMTAHAQAPSQPRKDAAQEIKRVMESPEFGQMEKRRGIRYIGPTWDSKDEKKSTYDFAWVEKLARFFSEAARFIAWTGGAILLAVALYFLARYVRLRAGRNGPRERPDFLFGLDVRPESLPDDVAGAAAALAREGRTREALSLLYRGALVRFLDQGLEFLRGDTEGDCQRKVDRAVPEGPRSFFRRLVAAWQSLAYGHRAVGADAVITLAGEWREQLPGGGRAMNRKVALRAALIVTPLVAFVLYAALNWYEIEEKSVRTGMSDAARRDPHLAFTRLLQRMGAQAEVTTSPNRLARPPEGGVLLLGGHRLAYMTPMRVRELDAWVQRGGMLVAQAEPPGIDDPLLERFGLDRETPAHAARTRARTKARKRSAKPPKSASAGRRSPSRRIPWPGADKLLRVRQVGPGLRFTGEREGPACSPFRSTTAW